MDKSIRLPNAIIIGAPRSGTTSLFFYLKQHPDIFLPVRKELHYFSYDLLAQNTNGPGDPDALVTLCSTREEYEAHYHNVEMQKAILEISPAYLYFSDVSERIRTELGNIKVIAILRKPVEKAFSQYMHLVRLNLETLDFHKALLAEKERQKAGWSDMWRYAESSLYSERIRKYISVFGKKNVKVILTDDLLNQPGETMKDIFLFLQIDTAFKPDTSKVHNRSGKPRSKLIANFFAKQSEFKELTKKIIPEKVRVPIRMAILNANSGTKPEMDEQVKNYLKTYFRNDILKLEKIIERKTNWLDESN